METFASLRDYKGIRLNENKDRFIQKNSLLTDEQKAEVLDFFRSHANLEAKVNNGNWNYNIPYEEFKRVMTSVDTQAKRLKKQTKELRKQKGLEGLVEGMDYIIFKDTSEYIAYKPLTHRGMRVIASNMVEPKLWCESSVMTWSPKEILPEGEPMKDGFYPGAKWCVAMETDKHWKKYTSRGLNFIVVCSKNPEMAEELKKVCLAYRFRELSREDSALATDEGICKKEYKYVEAVIADLDPLVRVTAKNLALERIQKCYCPEERAYKLSNEILPPREFLKLKKLDHPVIWEGDFDLGNNAPVRSLEGCPEKVTGDFVCIGCQNLTSLEGAPKYVGGSFYCSYCHSLTSLKGAPEYVGGRVYCRYCNNLTSLEGAPKSVGKNFFCSGCSNLTSLEGAPKHVGGTFDCSHCESLISLEGAPEYVGRDFSCTVCKNLTSLKGAPDKVGGNFKCSSCRSLTSLEGAPKHIEGFFDCSHCKSLISLEGAPENVGGKVIN